MPDYERKNILILCGFMGSGKSTVGRRLAAALAYDFADTDDMLYRHTGMTLAQMFARGGEAYFRDREHEVIRQAAQLERTVISTGGGVMTFERNADLLARRGLVIHIDRPFDACYQSIRLRRDRPIGQKSREELLGLYNARRPLYARRADFTLKNTATPEESAAQILAWLEGL